MGTGCIDVAVLSCAKGFVCTGEYFRGISFEAKAIYGMMIDRVSLSIKNGWLDEDGKTYIHYSVADIMADTGCGKNKILKCLKELEEDVHLINPYRGCD